MSTQKITKLKSLAEIAYARAAIRNMIERDDSGDIGSLTTAVVFLDMAETRVLSYMRQQRGIDSEQEG